MNPERLTEHFPVAVIGGGQAGLATSHELSKLGVDHVVLERGRIGQTWRDRWDSFCLVTPNWSVQLPDAHYDGPDPDGFMPRDEIVEYLERYASDSLAPVRDGVEVSSIAPLEDGGFSIETSEGVLICDAVVVATGAYQRPHRPKGASSLPTGLPQIDIDDYRNPEQLPGGKVLIIGSAQSGCQVSEELRESGREVVLACGRAPWGPRRIGGRDLFWWAEQMAFFETLVDDLPSPEARLNGNLIATGHDGGHDLSLRTLHDMGVTLAGRFEACDEKEIRFRPDLAESVAFGDEAYLAFRDDVFDFVAERGLAKPDLPDLPPFVEEGLTSLSVAELGAVIFATGFRPYYGALFPRPDAFDSHGFPIQHDGASTVVTGMYFVGVHFLRKRKSSLMLGVGEDAAVVAGQIAATIQL
ncbi:MAG TPA: NAD(P)-binding domain-containing protein [Acidimicrobiia bacterium]|nr:NAD(P)-binding domain-containing protein [Acidimicrobiia bacterium]